MNGLYNLAWRGYPAALIVAAALLLALSGVRLCVVAWQRPNPGMMQPLIWIGGFRRSIQGTALAGLGAGWLWHVPWLIAVALVVGFEETLECSLAIAALNAEPAGGAKTAARGRDARPTPAP